MHPGPGEIAPNPAVEPNPQTGEPDHGPDGRFQHGNTAAQVHGLAPRKGNTAILRSLLEDPDEIEVWDSAPIPDDASPTVAIVLRQQAVQRFRVARMTANEFPVDLGGKGALGKAIALLEAGERPERVTLKALEVHIRATEAGVNAAADQALTAYLRAMANDKLGESLPADDEEMPLVDPTTRELKRLGTG